MGGNRVRGNVIEIEQAIFQAVTHLLISTMEGLPATSRELCKARISQGHPVLDRVHHHNKHLRSTKDASHHPTECVHGLPDRLW